MLGVALPQQRDRVARFGVRCLEHAAGAVGSYPPQSTPVGVLVVVDKDGDLGLAATLASRRNAILRLGLASTAL